ncbi:cupin domain-containing protein [Oryzihumus leptocrescens]|nr:cupin domain-containing protein [Oryzihumus leptocrescens]
MNQKFVSDSADFYPARFVSKPWGREMIFAEIDDVYVGKVLFVNAGESLSLQFHEEKTETMGVISGRGRLEFGVDADALECAAFGPGDAVHLPAGILHRLIADEDLVLAEVSTAFSGWREDIVRVDDHYGRSGTTAP